MISKNNASEKINCSVGILTFNSEKTLLKCLESVSDFSEIIICDGGSTDKTIDIAKKFGCIVLQQDKKFKYKNNKISNFSGVRNQLLDQATYEWFLYIDSDEFLSEELANELGEIIQRSDAKGGGVYKMPRRFMLSGEIIDCASSYPNYQVRFFHKGYVHSFIRKLHERINVKKTVHLDVLKNHVFVPLETDFQKIKQKHRYYLNMEYCRKKDKPYRLLWISLGMTLKGILARPYRYVYILLFCRGAKLPLQHELLGQRYAIISAYITIKILFPQTYQMFRRKN